MLVFLLLVSSQQQLSGVSRRRHQWGLLSSACLLLQVFSNPLIRALVSGDASAFAAAEHVTTNTPDRHVVASNNKCMQEQFHDNHHGNLTTASSSTCTHDDDDDDHIMMMMMIPQHHQISAPAESSQQQQQQQQPQQQQHVYTSRDFVARYNGPANEEMTEQQAEIRDAILASRPGTGLSGPFGPWLAVPDIAQPAQALGRACRYGTSLSFDESEIVILLTGAKTKSHAEFDIHVGEGLKAGLTMPQIQAIPRDDAFSVTAVQEQFVPLLTTTRQKAIALYTAELLHTYSVSDTTYATTKAALDHQDSVLVEITSIAGYYTYAALTLNAFRIPSQ